jgi:predicted kinase
MIRAKVAWIRIRQERSSGQVDSDLYDELCAYLDLAERYTNPSPPYLMITHGVSGSGKTFGTQPLIESWGAIRIRSDIERKRMFGLDETCRTHSDVAHGLYTPAATVETYTRLATLAEQILRANFHVIVDATFLNRQERQTFHELAKQNNVPFYILSFHASDDTLRRRVAERSEGDRDASEATLEVLVYQLQSRAPLDSDERRFAIDVDTEDPHHLSDLSRRIQSNRP